RRRSPSISIARNAKRRSSSRSSCKSPRSRRSPSTACTRRASRRSRRCSSRIRATSLPRRESPSRSTGGSSSAFALIASRSRPRFLTPRAPATASASRSSQRASRRENDDYERAAASWTREASDQKKELRKVREQTLLDIQVALARLGEVDRLGQLERLPFEKKLAHLESFLEEARDKYVAQS